MAINLGTQNKIKFKQKRLNIIARYNEDISWIPDDIGDVVIYNKGEIIDSKFVVIKTMNFGREAETYVRAILDHYHILNRYKYVTFVQGNPFDHDKYFLQRYKTYFIGDYNILTQYSNEFIKIENNNNFIFNTHKHIVDLIWGNIHKRGAYREGDRIMYKAPETPYVLKYDTNLYDFNYSRVDAAINFKFFYEDILYLLNILGIERKEICINYAYGAQYFVHVSKILNKSYDWWLNFHKLIDYVENEIGSDRLPYMLEWIWPLIWDHKTN